MRLMREQVLPVLEAAGVDLVLCGHTHVYERSFLLHGHYGSAQKLQPEMIVDHGDGCPEGSGPYQKSRSGLRQLGTVYVNTGSAGHATPRRDLHGLNYPAMCVSLNVPGSVAIEISGRRLTSVFRDERGLRRDWFRIEKQP